MKRIFRSEIIFDKPSVPITHTHSLLTLGSCFSEHIGNKLQRNGFNVITNPTGVLFNPFSISQTLRRLLTKRVFEADDLLAKDEMWYSFAHSTLFSDREVDIVLEQINSSFRIASDQLQRADFLLITWGSAWVYSLKENHQVVANCHKMPTSLFHRRRLEINEIVEEYTRVIEELAHHTGLNIILTVSPIRHWKDGAHENTLSKSILHLAAEQLTKQYPCISYFPAFEIMMDELRDYRFYADDYFHPSSLAIDYIWEKFSDVYFNDATKELNLQVEKYRKMTEHRFLHPNSNESIRFAEKLKEVRTALINTHPFLADRL